MSNLSQVASELHKLITSSDERKPKPYDTTAQVIRVEGDTLWVHIPGGVDETPVKKTINARPGDEIRLHLAGGNAWVTGNDTAPPTDDSTANYATTIAIDADGKAINAIEDATIAQESADNAQLSAMQAQTAAQSAQEYANTANHAANNALTQLSVVEDVVGTLNWISEHATYKATTDTTVVDGKLYFTKSGDIYTPVANPSGNPSQQGYYEIDSIDEAVSNYVASHLTLTNAGLWIVNDNSSYKILLASDGMNVYDASGHLVSTFGESIIFDSSRPQKIGNNNVYVEFYDKNNSGSPNAIRIKADEFLLSNGQTIQDSIEGVENWFYSVAPTTSNPPASSWTTTNLKEQHLRDIYFDTTTGKSYRWSKDNNIYSWVEISDVQLAELANDLHTNYPPRSEFTVTPTDICSEVTATQNGANLVSRINQTASTVKIQATHVEIDGTATFNAIKSQADAAYDAKGAASTAESNAKTYADGKASTAESNAKTYADNKTSDMATNTGVASTYAAKSSAIARSQRIYYRKTTSGAPSKNTTWLSTSGTGYGNWSLSIPQLTSGTTKYPYLYTAVQMQTVAQQAAGSTCTCSDVLLDDTSTVIDGGTIITGSVNANAVNANSGTFDTANIPNLNASKITAGDIAVDRLKVNSISAINNNTGTTKISASKIDVGSITVGSLSDGSSYATKTYAETQASTAQSNAISAAASDATTKANVAEANGKKVATDYITKIDADGIYVSPSSQSPTSSAPGNSVKIDASGMEVFNSNSSIAKYSTDARIGVANSGHATIKSDGLHIFTGAEDASLTNEVAAFGSSAKIGKSNSGHLSFGTRTIVEGITETGLSVWGGDESSSHNQFAFLGYTQSSLSTDPGLVVRKESNGSTIQTSIYPDYIELPRHSIISTGSVGASPWNQLTLGLAKVKQLSSGEGNISINNTTGTCEVYLASTPSNDHGIYSSYHHKWMIHMLSDGYIRIPAAYDKTSTISVNACIGGSGVITRNASSSKRYKKDIEDIENAEALYNVNVRQFKYREDYLTSDDQRYDKVIPGFIVEELEEVYPIAVDYIDEQPEDWNIRYIIPGMLKLIQDQHKKIEELEGRIEALERSK